MRYEFGEFVLDVAARQLRRRNGPVHLSPKAFDLLQFLIEQRPRAVPKRELYDRLWPKTFVVDTNLPLLISEIRDALDDDAHRTIRTVQRHGYSFAAEVRERGSTSKGEAVVHVLVYGDREFPLANGENVVGREPSAEVRITSPSVSRRHAIISVSGDTATIIDLKSKNGTRLDGKPVAGSEVLQDGMVIAFGAVETVYRWSSAIVSTKTVI
jgi:DNA-binding winged helix-turn-helix (wHTH) protein